MPQSRCLVRMIKSLGRCPSSGHSPDGARVEAATLGVVALGAIVEALEPGVGGTARELRRRPVEGGGECLAVSSLECSD